MCYSNRDFGLAQLARGLVLLQSQTARVARLAWAARHAARVASDAASRAARSAAAPRPRPRSLAAAASSRAAREASDVADDIFECEYGRPRGSLPARDPPVPGVDVTAKDLKSDEAVWALYENWCKAFNKERSRDEMARGFSTFKRSAEETHRWNRAVKDSPDQQECLGEFCDGLDLDDVQEIADSSAQERGAGTSSGDHRRDEELRIDYPPNQSP